MGKPYGHRNLDMDGMVCCFLLDSLHRLRGDHGDDPSKALEERNHEVGSVLHDQGTFLEGSHLVAVHNQRNAEASGVLCCLNDVLFSIGAAMAAVERDHLRCFLMSSVGSMKPQPPLAFFLSSGCLLSFVPSLACCC